MFTLSYAMIFPTSLSLLSPELVDIIFGRFNIQYRADHKKLLLRVGLKSYFGEDHEQ